MERNRSSAQGPNHVGGQVLAVPAWILRARLCWSSKNGGGRWFPEYLIICSKFGVQGLQERLLCSLDLGWEPEQEERGHGCNQIQTLVEEFLLDPRRAVRSVLWSEKNLPQSQSCKHGHGYHISTQIARHEVGEMTKQNGSKYWNYHIKEIVLEAGMITQRVGHLPFMWFTRFDPWDFEWSLPQTARSDF